MRKKETELSIVKEKLSHFDSRFDNFDETQGGDWDEIEIRRFVRRSKTFIDDGLPQHDAERLAQAMLYRDRNKNDDRRVCFECRHFRKNARCRPGYLPSRFTLERCPGFELKTAR